MKINHIINEAGTGLDIDRSVPGRIIARTSDNLKDRTGALTAKTLPDYHPDDDYTPWSGKVAASTHDDEEDTFDQDYTGDEDGELREGDVVPFARPGQPLTWQQVPRDILLLANDWFWASEDNSGLDAVIDPKGYGNGTQNDVTYLTAKLQQKGWSIDFNDEYDKRGEFNLRLTNKRGQTVLLPIEDAQDFTGWAEGTSSHDSIEEGVRVANQQIPGTNNRAQSAYYPSSKKTTVPKLDKPLSDQELARLSQLAGIKNK